MGLVMAWWQRASGLWVLVAQWILQGPNTRDAARRLTTVVATATALAISWAASGAHAYTAYSSCDRFSGGCNVPLPFGLNTTLRVAVAQTSSNLTDTLEANAAKAAAWVGMAAKERARVVLFPEMALTGYFTSVVLTLAGKEGSATTANARLRAAEDKVAEACRQHGVYALVGVPVFFADVNATSKYCDGPCQRPWFNTVLLITPEGKKQYRQAKLYPCCPQDGSQGEWLSTFNITNTDGTVIPCATQICFDSYFPEIAIARVQAMQGAQVLFYMSWESDISYEWKLGLDGTGSAQGVVPARAATNQMWIVQANAGALVDNMVSEGTPGAGGGSHGQSRVVDPAGEVREQARVFGEQLLVHDLDLAMCSRPEYRMARMSLRSRVFGSMWAEGMRAASGPPMPIDW